MSRSSRRSASLGVRAQHAPAHTPRISYLASLCDSAENAERRTDAFRYAAGPHGMVPVTIAAHCASGRNLAWQLGIILSGQLVRPSLSAVQYGDDLNNVIFDPIGYDIRRVGDDEFACAGRATRSAEGRRCRQTRHRRANSLDQAERRGRVFRRNALANVFKAAKIAGSILQATRRHRGCISRLYRSSACFSDRASPESSS